MREEPEFPAMPVSAVSLIIPCYRDAEPLERTLGEIAAFPKVPEVLVVDATPPREAGAIREIVGRSGARYLTAAVPSRGAQMNQGARAASGDVFVFHHADTQLTAAHFEAVERVLAIDPELAGGAFFKDIGALYPGLGWATGIYRFYARHIGILYGDQSCFVRRGQFEGIGGYREIPLMEDVAMSRALRRSGRIALLDPPIRTSMRAFRRDGFLRRKLQNMLLVFLFRIGVSPEKLYRWYYRKRGGTSEDDSA